MRPMFSAISPRFCSSAASPTRSDGGRRACRLSRSALPAPLFLRRRQGPAGRLWGGGAGGFSPGLVSARPPPGFPKLYPGGDKRPPAPAPRPRSFLWCAAGPVIGGLFAQFAPAPLRLPYLAFLVLLCGAAGAIMLPRETVVQPKLLPDIELHPRIGVPPGIRLQFISPAVTGFAT